MGAPACTGSIELELPVMLSYDLEIGATRYFAGLDGGEVPLLLLFSGTVFTMAGSRIQAPAGAVEQGGDLPPPIPVWREAIDAHFRTARGSR